MSSALQAPAPALDMNKLNQFIGQFVTDLGAAVHSGMVVIGEKLGLYKALATRPMSSAELAKATQTDERYLREWLASQAAGGYITYYEDTKKFGLSEEQAFTLANPDSPAYLPGAFELALGSLAAVPRIAESFRSGAGMGWHEHADGVFHGCEKFFRPGYAANLVSTWIPALHDVQKKLEAGARVADVGCGKGASTLLMAQAFPNLTGKDIIDILFTSATDLGPAGVDATYGHGALNIAQAFQPRRRRGVRRHPPVAARRQAHRPHLRAVRQGRTLVLAREEPP